MQELLRIANEKLSEEYHLEKLTRNALDGAKRDLAKLKEDLTLICEKHNRDKVFC